MIEYDECLICDTKLVYDYLQDTWICQECFEKGK
jgi:ribosomal protein L37AE/L43A